jgi:hypothetical protein
MFSRGKSGWHLIEDKMIHTDSIMEKNLIQQLVSKGFSGRWRRTRRGIALGYFRYTPDVELSILHDGMNRRAIVEFKPNSVAEFPKYRRRAMRASSRFYGDAVCLLYVAKAGCWYFVEPKGLLQKTFEPTPGGITIDQLPKPKFAMPIMNRYGRSYWARPHHVFLKKTADGLELIVKEAFGRKSKRRWKRR